MKTARSGIMGRLLRGFGANGVMQASIMMIRLAEVPLLLYYWGAVGYGEWLMVATLPSFLALSDGGFAKSTQRLMTIRSSAGDDDGAQRVFQSGWLLLIGLSIAGLLLVACLGWLAPISTWLKLTTIDHHDLTITLIILAAQVFLSFQCALLTGAFASIRMYALGTLLQSACVVLAFVGLAVGAASGAGMVGAAIGTLLGWSTGYVLMRLVLIRRTRLFWYGYKQASFGEMRALIKPSLANMSFTLSDALNIQGLRLLVGLLAGPVSLAAFSTLRTLCRLALQPVLSISRSLEPEMSRAYGLADHVLLKTLLVRGNQVAIILSLALVSMLLALGQDVYRLWTKGQLDFDWPVFIALLVASFVNSTWCVSMSLLVSTNRHAKEAVWFLLIYGVMCLGVAAALLSHLKGGVGAAAAIVLVEILVCFMFIAASARVTNQGLREYGWQLINIGPVLSRWLGNNGYTQWRRR